MSEITPRDILLRIGGRTLQRHKVICWANGTPELKEAFSRADASTCATYIDRDGVVRTAGANNLRTEWVDLDGDGVRETPGILLEGSRTTGWDRSEEIDHANWTRDALAGVTANATTAPDGAATMDKVVEDGTNALHGFERLTPALTANTPQNVSIFAKGGERSWFRFRTTDKAGVLSSTWFNASTGVVGTLGAGHIARIEKVANSGFRCSLMWNSGTGATAPLVQVFMATADNSGAYAGDGVSGMYFWGAQFETDKAFASSYLKSVSSAITRIADTLTVPINFGPVDYTAVATIARPAWADAAGSIVDFPGIYDLGAGVAMDNRMYSDNATRTFQADIQTGAVNSFASRSILAGATINVVSQFKNLTTGGQVAMDVGAGQSSFGSAATAKTAFGAQTINVGRVGGVNYLYGVLLDLKFIRGLFSYAEAVAVL